VRWSPDGKAVVYVVGKNGVDNLWYHPLDNKPPQQITSFTSEKIYSFDFSPDGKRLAIARGRRNSYAILINLKSINL
jgi:Tol biopolymer transport system component